MKAEHTDQRSQRKKVPAYPASIIAARRQKGLTQSALAQRIACKQSAISMFERGNLQALSQEKKEALAQVLEISWPLDTDDASTLSPYRAVLQPQSYCPHFDCPANIPYQVGSRVFVMPRIKSEQNGSFCRYCGEVCETHCPHCHEIYQHGAHCPHCGHPYIPISETTRSPEQWQQWVQTQQQMLRQLP